MMVSRTDDTWEQGFTDAVDMFRIEIDKLLVSRYNDSRNNDNLLDLRLVIQDIKELVIGETLGIQEVCS